MTAACQVCGARTAHLQPCRACWRTALSQLEALPWLYAELQQTRRRQDHLQTSTGGHGSGETPLPWNERAADVSRDALAILTGWAITIGVPASGDIRQLTRLLAGGEKALHKRPDAPQFARDVQTLSSRIPQVINRPDVRKIHAGPCPQRLDDGSPCPGDVWLVLADRTPPHAECQGEHNCGSVWTAVQLASLGGLMVRHKQTLAAQAQLAQEMVHPDPPTNRPSQTPPGRNRA